MPFFTIGPDGEPIPCPTITRADLERLAAEDADARLVPLDPLDLGPADPADEWGAEDDADWLDGYVWSLGPGPDRDDDEPALSDCVPW